MRRGSKQLAHSPRHSSHSSGARTTIDPAFGVDQAFLSPLRVTWLRDEKSQSAFRQLRTCSGLQPGLGAHSTRHLLTTRQVLLVGKNEKQTFSHFPIA